MLVMEAKSSDKYELFNVVTHEIGQLVPDARGMMATRSRCSGVRRPCARRAADSRPLHIRG